MKPIVRISLGIIVVLAVGGGSFYGGMAFGKQQATTSLAARRSTVQIAGGTGSAAQGQTARSNMLFGEIKEVSADGLVVTDSSGNEITIKVANTTLIEKNMSVKVTDLAEGETVIISGTKASDGTITARSLQVAPAGRFNAEGGPAPAPQGSSDQGGFQPGNGQPGGAPPAP